MVNMENGADILGVGLAAEALAAPWFLIKNQTGHYARVRACGRKIAKYKAR